MKDLSAPSLPKLVIGIILGIGTASISTVLNDGYGYFDSLWPGLVSMCVASYYLIDLNAAVHASWILHGHSPNHFVANLLRAAVSLTITCILHAFYFVPVKMACLVVFSACWFGIVFNFRINKYRGKQPLYIGENALTDRVFGKLKNGGVWLLAAEIAGMALSACFYLS